MIENKSFREDLYYRINVIPINIPPLKERKTDIPLLLQRFISKYDRAGINSSVCPRMRISPLLAYSGRVTCGNCKT